MSKTACILIPYRDRAEHLKQFLAHYKGVLKTQLPIIVIEQNDLLSFNRAKLFNIGFIEEGFKYDTVILHDVDMLAENLEGYQHYDYPVHLATAASQFNHTCPYPTYFGGVTTMPSKIMTAINGFSNNFWGHSGEDDFLYKRVLEHGFEPHRIENKRYESLPHVRHIDQKLRNKNIKILNAPNDPTDGLSSCVYEVVDVTTVTGYDIDQSSGSIKGEYEYLHIKANL